MWRVLLSALLLALVSSPASSFKQFLEGKEDGFEVFVLPGSYYNLSSFDTTLMFNNKGPREIPMLVTVFAMEGERLDLSPVFVAGNSTLTVNLAELLPRYVHEAQFSDSPLKVAHPSDLRREPGTAHFKKGSLEVAYRGKWLEVSAQIRLRHKSGRYLFDEQLFAPSTGSAQLAAAWWKPRNNSKFDLILTNISQAPVSVVVEVVGEDDGEFLEASLGPRETRILNLRAATTHGAVLLKHSSVPGSVLARGQIYDSDLNYSSVVDFGDPATAESSALRGTGLRLAAVAGELLDPVVALFNRGTEIASVVIGVPLSIGEEVISVTLDAILIQPGNSAVVSEQLLEAI